MLRAFQTIGKKDRVVCYGANRYVPPPQFPVCPSAVPSQRLGLLGVELSPLRAQYCRSLPVKLAALPLDGLKHLRPDHPQLFVVHDVGLQPVLCSRHVPLQQQETQTTENKNTRVDAVNTRETPTAPQTHDCHGTQARESPASGALNRSYVHTPHSRRGKQKTLSSFFEVLFFLRIFRRSDRNNRAYSRVPLPRLSLEIFSKEIEQASWLCRLKSSAVTRRRLRGKKKKNVETNWAKGQKSQYYPDYDQRDLTG